MRARLILGGAFAFGAALVACVDLFHGTDFESACDVDAAACETADANAHIDATPPQDAGPDGPTDFCQWDHADAAKYAMHACAWLGACAGAMGDDAFGPCMIRATLAYDCAANPNRPVIGAAHAYWDCLAKSQTCGDVDRCLEPSGTHETCAEAGADYVACDPGTGTLIACAAGLATGSSPTGLESCVALGQTCSASGTAKCSGSTTACTGAGASCVGDVLHDCEADGGLTDYGVDCTSFGSGSCDVVTSACTATGEVCSHISAVSCVDGGLAVGCPSGHTEQVDCNAVLGLTNVPVTCDENAPGRAWDVSRACSVGASCPADSCNGTTVTSCARGATFTVDCTSAGFAQCATVTYPGDTSAHAFCVSEPGN